MDEDPSYRVRPTAWNISTTAPSGRRLLFYSGSRREILLPSLGRDYRVMGEGRVETLRSQFIDRSQRYEKLAKLQAPSPGGSCKDPPSARLCAGHFFKRSKRCFRLITRRPRRDG